METFPIVKHKDEAQYGHYRTKLTILQIIRRDGRGDGERKAVSDTLRPAACRSVMPPPQAQTGHPRLRLPDQRIGRRDHPKIKWRLKTKTPFSLEYGRFRKLSGGSRGVAPHDQVEPVEVEILVLDDDVPYKEAQHMLFRRKIEEVGSGKTYTRKTGDNYVIVEEWTDNPCVERVFCTDFHDKGKKDSVTAEALASVTLTECGKDGITYLHDNIAAGIHTPLTDAYRDEIRKQTNSTSLDEAHEKARSGC